MAQQHLRAIAPSTPSFLVPISEADANAIANATALNQDTDLDDSDHNEDQEFK